jgi:DNA-binding transcriptional ArsR family regulator
MTDERRAARHEQSLADPLEARYFSLRIDGTANLLLGALPGGKEPADKAWFDSVAALLEPRGYHLHLSSVDLPRLNRRFSEVRISTVDVLFFVHEFIAKHGRRKYIDKNDIVREYYAAESETPLSSRNADAKASRHLRTLNKHGLLRAERLMGRKVYYAVHESIREVPPVYKRLEAANPLYKRH